MMARNAQEQCEAQIRQALAAGDPARLQAVVTTHHPADIADALDRVDTPGRPRVFQAPAPAAAAEVLGEAGAEVTRVLLRVLPPAAAAALLDRLPADDAAEVLRESAAGAVMRSARGDPAAHRLDGPPTLVHAPAPEGAGWQGWPPLGRQPA